MMDVLHIVGRAAPLFRRDLERHGTCIDETVAGSRFLVIGGAGSIGASVVHELFVRQPRLLHVVDISENGLAELVRDLRSSHGYTKGEFHAYCMDCLGEEFTALMGAGSGYDYVLNLSALKHVRSEKDPFTLMRMIDVNIFGTLRTVQAAIDTGAKRYFCVSTDKASSPVNMMGASKRIMELFLSRESERIDLSTARFANVAFSDGSLLDSWTRRLARRQPIVAPSDVRRYFVTDHEAGVLCLFSALLGENRDLLFPRLDESTHSVPLTEIAIRFIEAQGYEPVLCHSEAEARERAPVLPDEGRWACYFEPVDTVGEKEVEVFYDSEDMIDWDRFEEIGVAFIPRGDDDDRLDVFVETIQSLRRSGRWEKAQLVELFERTLGTFAHVETGRYLDEKM